MEVDLEGLSREEALEEIERIKKKLQKRKRRSERRDVRKEKVRELNLQLQKDALTSEVPKETAFREEQRTKADAPNLTQMLDPADDLGQPRVAVKDGNEIVLVKGTDELLLLREKGKVEDLHWLVIDEGNKVSMVIIVSYYSVVAGLSRLHWFKREDVVFRHRLLREFSNQRLESLEPMEKSSKGVGLFAALTPSHAFVWKHHLAAAEFGWKLGRIAFNRLTKALE